LTLGLLLPEAKSKETLAGLARSATSALARDVASFGLASLEPPKADALAVDNARPLTPEEKQRFDAGKTMYEATCLACHQVHGMGQAGLAPPLLGSEWAAGSDERLIRIVINGLRGPIKVKGETFELDMPALGVLDDDQIAAVLTYVRREWTHRFEPVTPAKVKKVREATASREDAWTMVDLLKVP
jgi:mono/diheme cytochrome c family protein